jgi:hypothetical protein
MLIKRLNSGEALECVPSDSAAQALLYALRAKYTTQASSNSTQFNSEYSILSTNSEGKTAYDWIHFR